MMQTINIGYCYTSTQNTCTRLVQIALRDINKYAHCCPRNPTTLKS